MSPDPRAARPDLLDLPPPPPASGGALAWLRWTITMVRAGRGRNRLAIRRHHAPTGGTESLGTVAIALGADLAMVLAKAVAALLTGGQPAATPRQATPSGMVPSCSTGRCWPRSASS